MQRLSIETLGALHVSLDKRAVTTFDSDKVRALLVYLAAESSQPHRREQLAGYLWPELPETYARKSLRQALYNLREILGDRGRTTSREPFLLATPQSIQFNPHSDHWLDVSACTAALARCESHPHRRLEVCETCMADLEGAVGLYKGDFLADFSLKDNLAFEEWALLLREHLRREVMVAFKQLAIYHEGRGDIQSALRYTRRGLEIEPLWEAGHRRSMRLLALGGQRDAALAQYRFCRAILEAELGVEPDRHTRALYERLRAEADGSVPSDDLPTHLTPFVGRETELAELRALLRDEDCRLVTVLGPGGAGKTRLALQAARALRYDFPDGVCFVPLSALSSPEGLLPAVAGALGFTFQERGSLSLQAQLGNYLRDKRLLLLLDSFETVLEGAGWLAETLRLAPHLKALVTSRARLNLKGEQRFALSGMRYPGGEGAFDPSRYSAVELFAEGARRASPGFDLPAANLQDVARICRLVEGMPLGLLLAAAWVDAYTLEEIAAQIEGSLDFLSADWAGVPPRGRSQRATLDYSWRLLGERERAVFIRLSVFRGVFSREAAERVAGANVLNLRGLVDKCMLEISPDGSYRMHDLVRQYVAERLVGEPELEGETRERHCAYYFERLQGWGADLKCNRQGAALAEMDQDVGNLQAAWGWVLSQADVDRLGLGLEVLGRYYDLRGRHAEARLHYEPALAWLAQLPDTVENRLLRVDTIVKYSLSAWRYDPADNLARLAEAERLLEALPEPDEERLTRVHFWMGRAHYAQGTVREALGYYQQMLPMARELGDPEMVAIPSSNLAQTMNIQGYFGKAEPLLREAAPLFEALGNWGEWCRAQAGHGYAIAFMGSYQAGVAEALRVLERARELDYLTEIAFAHGLVCMVHIIAGNAPNSALQEIILGVEAARQSSDWGYVSMGLGLMAWSQARLGRFDAAEASMAESQAILHEKLGGNFVLTDLITAASAELAFLKGDLRKAIELAHVAVSMAQAYGGILVEGMARWVWGQVLAKMTPPQWDEAEGQMAESLRLFETGQAQLPAARTHLAWGEICRERGDFEPARQHWEKAAAQFEASVLTEELECTRALMDGLDM